MNVSSIIICIFACIGVLSTASLIVVCLLVLHTRYCFWRERRMLERLARGGRRETIV
jgi:hypothetical protein